MEGATPPTPSPFKQKKESKFVNVLGAQPGTKNLATGVNSTMIKALLAHRQNWECIVFLIRESSLQKVNLTQPVLRTLLAGRVKTI